MHSRRKGAHSPPHLPRRTPRAAEAEAEAEAGAEAEAAAEAAPDPPEPHRPTRVQFWPSSLCASR